MASLNTLSGLWSVGDTANRVVAYNNKNCHSLRALNGHEMRISPGHITQKLASSDSNDTDSGGHYERIKVNRRNNQQEQFYENLGVIKLQTDCTSDSMNLLKSCCPELLRYIDKAPEVESQNCDKHFADDSDDSGTMCGDGVSSSPSSVSTSPTNEDCSPVRNFFERFQFSTRLPPPLPRNVAAFIYPSIRYRKRRAPPPPPPPSVLMGSEDNRTCHSTLMGNAVDPDTSHFSLMDSEVDNGNRHCSLKCTSSSALDSLPENKICNEGKGFASTISSCRRSKKRLSFADLLPGSRTTLPKVTKHFKRQFSQKTELDVNSCILALQSNASIGCSSSMFASNNSVQDSDDNFEHLSQKSFCTSYPRTRSSLEDISSLQSSSYSNVTESTHSLFVPNKRYGINGIQKHYNSSCKAIQSNDDACNVFESNSKHAFINTSGYRSNTLRNYSFINSDDECFFEKNGTWSPIRRNRRCASVDDQLLFENSDENYNEYDFKKLKMKFEKCNLNKGSHNLVSKKLSTSTKKKSLRQWFSSISLRKDQANSRLGTSSIKDTLAPSTISMNSLESNTVESISKFVDQPYRETLTKSQSESALNKMLDNAYLHSESALNKMLDNAYLHSELLNELNTRTSRFIVSQQSLQKNEKESKNVTDCKTRKLVSQHDTLRIVQCSKDKHGSYSKIAVDVHENNNVCKAPPKQILQLPNCKNCCPTQLSLKNEQSGRTSRCDVNYTDSKDSSGGQSSEVPKTESVPECRASVKELIQRFSSMECINNNNMSQTLPGKFRRKFVQKSELSNRATLPSSELACQTVRDWSSLQTLDRFANKSSTNTILNEACSSEKHIDISNPKFNNVTVISIIHEPDKTGSHANNPKLQLNIAEKECFHIDKDKLGSSIIKNTSVVEESTHPAKSLSNSKQSELMSTVVNNKLSNGISKHVDLSKSDTRYSLLNVVKSDGTKDLTSNPVKEHLDVCRRNEKNLERTTFAVLKNSLMQTLQAKNSVSLGDSAESDAYSNDSCRSRKASYIQLKSLKNWMEVKRLGKKKPDNDSDSLNSGVYSSSNTSRRSSPSPTFSGWTTFSEGSSFSESSAERHCSDPYNRRRSFPSNSLKRNTWTFNPICNEYHSVRANKYGSMHGYICQKSNRHSSDITRGWSMNDTRFKFQKNFAPSASLSYNVNPATSPDISLLGTYNRRRYSLTDSSPACVNDSTNVKRLTPSALYPLSLTPSAQELDVLQYGEQQRQSHPVSSHTQTSFLKALQIDKQNDCANSSHGSKVKIFNSVKLQTVPRRNFSNAGQNEQKRVKSRTKKETDIEGRNATDRKRCLLKVSPSMPVSEGNLSLPAHRSEPEYISHFTKQNPSSWRKQLDFNTNEMPPPLRFSGFTRNQRSFMKP